MKKFKQLREEIVNAAGSGGVAGIGVGEHGEPPVNHKKTIIFRRKKKE